MALGRRQPPQAAEPCECAARVAELERQVAALARHAARHGGTDATVHTFNRNHDNQADAAVIRQAAQRDTA